MERQEPIHKRLEATKPLTPSEIGYDEAVNTTAGTPVQWGKGGLKRPHTQTKPNLATLDQTDE